MLWRPLRDVLPRSAVLDEHARVELRYPRHRELRTWPAFDLIEDVEAEPEAALRSEVITEITETLGGSVRLAVPGPMGTYAALWAPVSYPPWYRIVIWASGQQAVTPSSVRVWGAPAWSATGQLAVSAFDGVRRGIVAVDPRDGTTQWWSRPASSSYRLLALGTGNEDALAVRCDHDGSAWLVRAVRDGADHCLQSLRPADDVHVQVVSWAHDEAVLEGLLALPPGPGPHPTIVLLHGGPVAGLACGEHPDLSDWVAAGFAVFMPDFRASGIAGERAMTAAFQRVGLPDVDPEVGDVLTGVDTLVARGMADASTLFLLGHSYGGYLAGRILTHDHRFRAAVCCEAVADLRMLDAASQRMQADWLGGDAQHAAQAWAAASPVEQAGSVRTPMLLIYASGGRLASQGRAWYTALTRVGVPHKLALLPGADHVFSSVPAQSRLRREVVDWFRLHCGRLS